MRANRAISILLVALLGFAAVAAGADDRTEPIDVMIALDKSLSMVDEIEAVKEYVIDTLVGELLIPGDFLHVIAFYGETDIAVSRDVIDEDSLADISFMLANVEADGYYTDIGNALDVLRTWVERRGDDRPKYLLLITDGKQEAPQDSPYYSPDGSFNHAFLDNTRTIQREGWRIQVLGIGSATVAQELAEELAGSFGEVSESASAEEIAEQTASFLGRLDITGTPQLSPVGRDGRATLSFAVTSSGHQAAATVEIDRVNVGRAGGSPRNALGTPLTVTVPADGTEQVTLSLALGRDPAPGPVSVGLGFGEGETLIPARFDVTIERRSTISEYRFVIIPVAVLLLAAIVIAILLMTRKSAAGSVSFQLNVEGQTVGRDRFSLRPGKRLYLAESGGVFRIDTARTPKSIGALTAEEGTLILDPVKEDRISDVPPNVLDHPIEVRSEDGGRVTVLFARVD